MATSQRSCRGQLILALAMVVAATACSNDAATAPAAAEPAVASQVVPVAPVAAQMAHFGGGILALAEVCGDYSAAQLGDMKEAQRMLSGQSGMPGPAFDAAFDAGYAEGKTKMAGASAADRERACAQAGRMQGS